MRSLILPLFLLLSACSGYEPSETLASTSPSPYHDGAWRGEASTALGQPGFPVIGAAGSLWVTTPANTFASALDDVQVLGLASTRVGVGGRRDRIVPTPSRIARAHERLAQAAAAHIAVYLAIGAYEPRSAGEAAIADAQAAGRAWGAVAAEWPGTAIGLSIMNEVEGRIAPDVAAATAAAFCSGVREVVTDPAFVCLGSGTRSARAFRQISVPALAALAPYLESGLISGINLHLYKNARAMYHHGRGYDASADLDELLATANLPTDTPVYVTESNVQIDTFDSEAEAAEGLTDLLTTLVADGRVRWISVYSPWAHDHNDERYQVPPGSAMGEALAAFAGGGR